MDAKTGAVSEYSTKDARDPHSLVFAPDGSLWFTAPDANLLAKLDTKTGTLWAYRVSTPDGQPEAIIAAPDGFLWVALSGSNAIASVAPSSGRIAEYSTPFLDARPQRLVALERPVRAIYYTDTGRGTLGRFDIERKSFKEWRSPSGTGSQPYGIAADGDGILWYNELRANQLVRFDPHTERFARFTLPSPESEARHMASDAKGRVWLALSGANKVALIE